MARKRVRTENSGMPYHVSGGPEHAEPRRDDRSVSHLAADIKVAVAILTWNRKDLFKRTLRSLKNTEYPYALSIVDNGSTDGTERIVRSLGGYLNTTGNHTAGYGMNLAITRALMCKPDIVVFTADDYEYRSGWLETLVNFWKHAPDSVILVTCNLEPVYGWNTVRGMVEYGGVRALVRDSVPGSNWSFRARDWPLIGPLQEKTGGEDLAVCARLRERGYSLCALDLAEHIGEKQSSWGNRSYLFGQPLDRERWGI